MQPVAVSLGCLFPFLDDQEQWRLVILNNGSRGQKFVDSCCKSIQEKSSGMCYHVDFAASLYINHSQSWKYPNVEPAIFFGAPPFPVFLDRFNTPIVTISPLQQHRSFWCTVPYHAMSDWKPCRREFHPENSCEFHKLGSFEPVTPQSAKKNWMYMSCHQVFICKLGDSTQKTFTCHRYWKSTQNA